MKTLSRLCTLSITLSLLSLFLNHKDSSVPDHYSATGAISLDVLNTTVVILNWSRLGNVKRIVSQICSTLLHDTVRSIIIWNNNPSPLSFAHDFIGTPCPSSRLEIINSSENLYFQARYMACARASTPYCFIQDDDFLVLPEIIKSLHARIHGTPSVSSIHIQPTDELLTSELRTIRVDHGGLPLHTTFAWLGYGTMIRRQKAAEFLQLLDVLGVEDEERKMADNYFTILSNEVPERWFDAGIPLGGGQPFTVGQEGEDRNNRHILRATELLHLISEMDEDVRNKLPYISLERDQQRPNLASRRNISRAPCHATSCILETSIALLPGDTLDMAPASRPDMILDWEKQRRVALGANWVDGYIRHPPSNAVDREAATAFRSIEYAKEGDWIGLDLTTTRHYAGFNLVVLVDGATELILRKATLEISQNGSTWDGHFAKALCSDHEIQENLGAGTSILVLRRCVFSVENAHVRSVRLRVTSGTDEIWSVYEVFVD